MNTNMRRILVLCSVGVFLAGIPTAHSKDDTTWDGLRERLMACGAEKKQCAQLRVAMQKRGVGAPEAETILQPTFEAARAELPIDMMLDRVLEGTAKGALPEQIVQASERRRVCLLQATRLMEKQRVEYSSRERTRLVEGAALAMESGLTPEALGAVMQMWHRKTARQLANAIEVGEMLRLNGLGDKIVTEMMCDYLDRDLRRTEMRRAMRSVVNLHRRGVTDDQMGRALWGKSAGEHYGQTDRADTGGPAMTGRGSAAELTEPAHGESPQRLPGGGDPLIDRAPGSGGNGPSPGGTPDTGGTPSPGRSNPPGGGPDGAPNSGGDGPGPRR